MLLFCRGMAGTLRLSGLMTELLVTKDELVCNTVPSIDCTPNSLSERNLQLIF